jgi:hypothetical protein
VGPGLRMQKYLLSILKIKPKFVGLPARCLIAQRTKIYLLVIFKNKNANNSSYSGIRELVGKKLSKASKNTDNLATLTPWNPKYHRGFQESHPNKFSRKSLIFEFQKQP